VLRKLLVNFIRIVIGLVIVAVVLNFSPPLRIALLAASGRATGCPWQKALASYQDDRVQREVTAKMMAACRLIRKDADGYQLLATPRGNYWIPPGNTEIAGLLAEQERGIYGTGEEGVHPNDVVLDCGANIGVFTTVALARGAKTIVAIEPNPQAVECLRRTFSSEIAAGRVILYPKGVWDKDDMLELMLSRTDPAMDGFVIHYSNIESSVKVPLTTIDKLAAELKLPRVDFIKMDIEGAEQRALQGAAGVLHAYHPRMAISSYHLYEDAKRIPAIVHTAWNGYQQQCGSCEDKIYDVRPNVYFFR